MSTQRRADALLASLAGLDTVLASAAFFAPGLWFRIFHGAEYVDPQGLLPRAGAAWAAFALFQGIALLRWKRAPEWLAIAAGIRFSDVFTDWTYLAFCHDVTAFGRVSLLAASPANLVFGLLLLREFRRVRRAPLA